MKIYSLLLAAVLVIVVAAGFTLAGNEALTEKSLSSVGEVASWSADPVHSKIGFKVKHLGISNVRGEFKDYDVSLSFDPADLSTLEASTSVQIASITTDNQRRDNHLRSPDFFSADEFPVMTFVSKEVRNIDGSEFELVGDLTIRDVTKEVVLEAEFFGTASMRGSERAAFEARTKINRLDYELKWNRMTEAGGFVVGHDVTIILELELVEESS
ncbi:MAG: YceI family protein [Rhodothermales bacterium]